MREEKFNVTGMSCSACSSRVEKVVTELEGSKEVSVNLLTGTMKVAFDEEKIGVSDIISAVTKAGYGATKAGEKTQKNVAIEKVENITEKMRKRLIASGILLVVLIITSLTADMSKPMTTALIQIGLLTPIVLLNNKFFVKGIPGMFRGSFNMDTLVALGAGSSILYGLFSVFKMAEGFQIGNLELVKMYYRPMYFQSAGTILTLISIGKYLETKSKGKTSEAIKALVNLAPDTATIIRDGKEEKISASELKKGDIMVVRPGERFAADGIIVDGKTNVDESAITGESLPVEKITGDEIISATINKSGFIKVRCEKTGEDTTLSQIIELVEEASSSKAPIAKLADKIAGIFVPTVICVAIITTLVWLYMGKGFSFALYMGITVLVISCPCALGLATPVAIMVGTGKGAEMGVLIKSGVAFQTASEIDTIVLDKTGTVTTGHPVVTDVILYEKGKKVFENKYEKGKAPEEELKDFLESVKALEVGSEHPLAEAVIEFTDRNHLEEKKAVGFEAVPGEGVKALIEGEEWGAGNKKLAKRLVKDIGYIEKDYSNLAGKGKTPLIMIKNGIVKGIIAVADEPKENSKEAIGKLREMGINVLMLTGDNEGTAKAIGEMVGIDKVISNVYPGDKEMVVRKLKEEGKKVAMVGDGINDAPALVRSDVGIAIGAGTDVAIESADIVLMHSDLIDAVTAIKLSKAVLRNIKQNLGWAFGYNTILIPLASGLFFPVFNIKLNPMVGALMMSMSSFIVVSNALRLRFFKGEEKNNKETKEFRKEVNVYKMVCPKCEAHVEEELKKLGGVVSVKADHKNNKVEIIGSKILAIEEIKEAVRKAGYEMEEKMDNVECELKVQGMMCKKCEAHVEEALKEIEGVVSAKADHEKEKVKVVANKNVNKKELEDAIRKAGYEVMNSLKKEIRHELKVQGMMCKKCEAHVEEALKKIKGVVSAKADHEKEKVTVVASDKILIEELKKVIVDAGYDNVDSKEYKLNVEGMMCPKCEAHVKEAVEEIDGVTNCVASHEKGLVVVEAEKDGLTEEIKESIIKAGYEVK